MKIAQEMLNKGRKSSGQREWNPVISERDTRRSSQSHRDFKPIKQPAPYVQYPKIPAEKQTPQISMFNDTPIDQSKSSIVSPATTPTAPVLVPKKTVKKDNLSKVKVSQVELEDSRVIVPPVTQSQDIAKVDDSLVQPGLVNTMSNQSQQSITRRRTKADRRSRGTSQVSSEANLAQDLTISPVKVNQVVLEEVSGDKSSLIAEQPIVLINLQNQELERGNSHSVDQL
jgi:hypothetical protein